jgi:hypothetical protein
VQEPHRKSLTQRFFLALMPGRAEEIERESREWQAICPNCGHGISFWEMGGIRYKAYAKGKSMPVKCRSCGERRWHKVERRRAGA